MKRKKQFVPTEEEEALSLMEVRILIEEIEDKVIDKRTKEYKQWMNDINRLFHLYNHKIGWRAYRPIQ